MPRMFLLYSYHGLTLDGGLNGKPSPSYFVIPAKERVKKCHRRAESSPPQKRGPRLAPGKEQGARD
jgi:hypothetical protein